MHGAILYRHHNIENPSFHASNFHTPYLLKERRFPGTYISPLNRIFVSQCVYESSVEICKAVQFTYILRSKPQELSVRPYLWIQQTPLKLPKGSGLYKAHSEIFIYIWHIVLNVLSPWTTTRWETYIPGLSFCNVLEWLKHRHNGRIDYRRQSSHYCSHFSFYNVSAIRNPTQDIANKYTSKHEF